MFISQTNKTPSFKNFEYRSTRYGMYPDIITLTKDTQPNKTLEGDYYVSIFGWTQSTFTLIYYTENERGDRTAINLMTGQK